MFKNPFSFEGRIRRLEYFFGIIISWLASIIIGYIISLIYLLLGDSYEIIFLSLWIFCFPILYFSLTQIVKRAHDIGRSGNIEFTLAIISYFIPFFIVLFIPFNLYLLFKAGEKGPNKYGDDPKGVGNTSQSGGGFTPPNNPQYPTGGYQNGNNFGGYNGGYNNPQQWQQQGQQPQGGGFYNGGYNNQQQGTRFYNGGYNAPQTPPQPKRGGGKDFDGDLYGKAK